MSTGARSVGRSRGGAALDVEDDVEPKRRPRAQRPAETAGPPDSRFLNTDTGTQPRGRRRGLEETEAEVRVAGLRSLSRYRSVEVITGFLSFLLTLLSTELAGRIPFFGRFVSDSAEDNPRRLRLLLERFGGAFIKFGQLMSMRSDILPHAYCQALSSLFDRVPSFPTQIARDIIERQLGAPISELFLEFSDKPLGAASFGQVHLVRLRDDQDGAPGQDAGRLAAVKVCRPGSARTIETDGRLLLVIGHIVDSIGLLGRIRLVPVLRDVVKWTRKEIHYLQEAKNADHLHELTAWNPRQRIPYIYWHLTSEHVLTMEFLEGPTVSELIRRFEARDPALDDDLAELSCDRHGLARNIWQTFMLHAFVGRVFHGDPHPGNVIVLPENVAGFIDFGLLGRLNEEARREQALLLTAVAQENIERIFVAVLDLLDAPRGLLVTDTYESFSDVADAWLDACDNPGAPIQEKSLQRLVNVSMDIAREVGLVMHPQTILFFKGLLSIDALVLRLYPDFDYKKESRRVLRLVRMYELEKLYAPGNMLDSALLVQLMANELPGFVAMRLQDFEQGQRQIYRKLNLIPVIARETLRLVALVCFAGLALVVGDRYGLLASVWASVPRSQVAWALQLVADHWLIPVLVAAVSLWGARVLNARTYVKVQRE